MQAEPTFAPREILFSAEAEAAVIGAVMADQGACADAFDRLAPEHFGDALHADLWRVMGDYHRAGKRLAPHHVADRLGDDDRLVSWGGAQQLLILAELADFGGLAGNVEAVADRAKRRGLLKLARGIEAQAANIAAKSGDEILAELERGASDLAHDGVSADAFLEGGAVVETAIRMARARNGRIAFPTGLHDVDDALGGFNAGELAIIAGRPGMGKSLAAQAVAKASAAAGLGTILFSQEMAEEALGLRLACDLAFDPQMDDYGWPGGTGNAWYDSARKNRLSPEQWARLDAAAQVVARWPLKIDVRPGLTVGTMEAAARRTFRAWERQGVKAGPILVDHLGLTKPEINRQGAKHAEVADVSRALAVMAKRLGVPVIALCQLNRQVESRDDKRPQLSDLRQAGEIEEDARQVIFMYRPEYYLRQPLNGATESMDERIEREAKASAAKNKLFWIIAKNSNGGVSQIETFCDVACAAIRNRRTA